MIKCHPTIQTLNPLTTAANVTEALVVVHLKTKARNIPLKHQITHITRPTLVTNIPHLHIGVPTVKTPLRIKVKIQKVGIKLCFIFYRNKIFV